MSWAESAASLVGALRPADTRGLSATGRAYLLDLTFARHRFAISIAPIVSTPLLWFAWQEQNATPLLLWIGFFLCFGLVLIWVWRRYAADIQTMEAAEMVRTHVQIAVRNPSHILGYFRPQF